MDDGDTSMVGLVAIVVGGGGEIGAACGFELARRGATTYLADTDEAALDERQKIAADRWPNVVPLALDVTDNDSVKKATAFVSSLHGKIDIVVLSAGYSGDIATLDETSDSQWARVLDVNLLGAARCARLMVPKMPLSGGRVIIVSSIVAYAPRIGRSAYGASKAALSGLTRLWALEFAHLGVTVNAVCPGPTDTAFFRRSIQSEDDLRRREAAIPLGRLVSCEDVANCVAFFAAPGAGAITGQNLHVNGGEYMN